MRPAFSASVLLLLAGCTANSSLEGERTATTKQPIIGGTVSTTAQDATVMLSDNGTFSCTGTLIAPNLVLTARHCIAQLSETGECGTVLSDGQPTAQGVSLGVNATAGARVARGIKFYVPATKDMCGTDIALIQLDKDIPNARIAKVRFTALTVGETTTAVGYGDTGNTGQQAPSRLQRAGVKVEAIGPQNGSYRTKAGQTLPYQVPNGDFSTSESTCFGDSGGPLFDAQGRVVGVTSRGIDDSCLDRPSIFTGVIFNQKLIEDAAKSAGHPLDTANTPPPNSPDNTTPSNEPGDRGDENDGKTTKTGGNNDDEEETTTKPKRSIPTMQSSGCSVPNGAMNGPAGVAYGLVLALAAALHRRRRHSEHPTPAKMK